jgi:alpha-galactosidase
MADHWPDTIITPSGAGWTPMENVDIDFSLLNGMAGVLGFSGSIAELPESARERIKFWIAFYKQWRGFIAGSIAHLLTPPRGIQDREGWAALQLQSPHDTTSLLFAYRLPNTSYRIHLYLRGLDEEREYQITDAGDASIGAVRATGRDLMGNGLDVDILQVGKARLLVVQPLG